MLQIFTLAYERQDTKGGENQNCQVKKILIVFEWTTLVKYDKALDWYKNKFISPSCCARASKVFITMSSCSGLVTTFMYSSSRVVHSCTITNLVTEKKNCLQANPTLKSYMVKFGHHMGETILFFNVGQFCIVLNNDDPLKEDIFLTTI